MKILFATYPFAFHTPGGGEFQLLMYKKNLEGLGVSVDFFDMWNPQFNNYDLVHYFSCVAGAVPFCSFIKGIKLPLVVSSSLWITEASKHNYDILSIRNQLNLADKILTNSDIESENLSKTLDLPISKFSVIYNGVDEHYLTKVPASLFRDKFSINNPFFLNVANIEPRKNQLVLAKAMKKFPSFKLVIIGNVRDPNYYNQVIAENKDQLIYLPFIENDSEILKSAHSASSLFVMPSLLETPSIAALEAFILGSKIVITSEGSAEEYFKNKAFYVDPNSLESIEEGIAKALSAKAFDCADINIKSWSQISIELKNIYDDVIIS
jgi:glycosyltransferase involved in cell wall biosynthesis